MHEIGPATASEDFGLFGTAWNVPSVFWVVGGIDPATYAKAEKAGKLDELPANHAPDFAPVIHPTLAPASRRCWRRQAPGWPGCCRPGDVTARGARDPRDA